MINRCDPLSNFCGPIHRTKKNQRVAATLYISHRLKQKCHRFVAWLSVGVLMVVDGNDDDVNGVNRVGPLNRLTECSSAVLC